MPHDSNDKSTAGIDDSVLMRLVASGDRTALAALYDRYAALATSVATSILRDGREAEDAVHDGFLEIWRRAVSYEPSRASVRAWIVLVVRCRALDRLRSRRVRTTEPLGDEPRGDAAGEPDALADRCRVTGALAELPVPQREVIELAYFEGLTSSEIADRLGIPIGTVKSRTAGALRSLRERLGVDEDGCDEGAGP